VRSKEAPLFTVLIVAFRLRVALLPSHSSTDPKRSFPRSAASRSCDHRGRMVVLDQEPEGLRRGQWLQRLRLDIADDVFCCNISVTLIDRVRNWGADHGQTITLKTLAKLLPCGTDVIVNVISLLQGGCDVMENHLFRTESSDAGVFLGAQKFYLPSTPAENTRS
jgi:hypothetical protein